MNEAKLNIIKGDESVKSKSAEINNEVAESRPSIEKEDGLDKNMMKIVK